MFIDSCNSFRLNQGEIPKYTNEKQQKSFYLYCMLVKFLGKKDSSKTTARITPHTEYLLLDNAGPCNRSISRPETISNRHPMFRWRIPLPTFSGAYNRRPMSPAETPAELKSWAPVAGVRFGPYEYA